jgi:hypothetical protein
MDRNTGASDATAQGATPTDKVSPQMAAAALSDFSAFERAEQSRMRGEQVSPVERPAEADEAPLLAGKAGGSKRPAGQAAAAAQAPASDDAASAAVVESKKTRAEKEQDRINASIRTAVDAARAEDRARIAELEARVGAAPAKPAAAAAAAVTEKPADRWKRIAAMDGAPQLKDFESIAEHNTAMAVFVGEVLLNEQRTAAAATELEKEHYTRAQGRVDGFLGKLDAASKADPTFVKSLAPEVVALKPFGALKPGEAGGPANFVAEELMDSEIPDAMLRHLSKPGELARVLQMPPIVAGIADPVIQKRAHMQHMRRQLHHIEGRLLAAGAAPAGAASATASTTPVNKKPIIADVPPPAAVTIKPGSTTDPRAQAIAASDFAAFDAIEMDRLQQKRARS